MTTAVRIEVCTTHNGDAWCFRCCPANQAPAWWIELRGGLEPTGIRPPRKSPLHKSNARNDGQRHRFWERWA
jgi:hypothetical protein